MRWIRYRLRRLWLTAMTYDHRACSVPRCAESRVGLSVWCRRHTDEILEHRKSPELEAALARMRGD